MGELLDFVKSKTVKNSNSVDLKRKVIVKNKLQEICDKYLVGADDVLEIEVLPNTLQYVLSSIDEEPLKSKYVFVQISESMFRIKPMEVTL